MDQSATVEEQGRNPSFVESRLSFEDDQDAEVVFWVIRSQSPSPILELTSQVADASERVGYLPVGTKCGAGLFHEGAGRRSTTCSGVLTCTPNAA